MKKGDTGSIVRGTRRSSWASSPLRIASLFRFRFQFQFHSFRSFPSLPWYIGSLDLKVTSIPGCKKKKRKRGERENRMKKKERKKTVFITGCILRPARPSWAHCVDRTNQRLEGEKKSTPRVRIRQEILRDRYRISSSPLVWSGIEREKGKIKKKPHA